MAAVREMPAGRRGATTVGHDPGAKLIGLAQIVRLGATLLAFRVIARGAPRMAGSLFLGAPSSWNGRLWLPHGTGRRSGAVMRVHGGPRGASQDRPPSNY